METHVVKRVLRANQPMTRADHTSKNLIVDILAKSFDDNQSVNYIVRQDSKRRQRIRALMAYSFEVCHSFGEVFLSDDKKACALVLFPEQRRTSLRSILLDIRLIVSCVGLANIRKALIREAKIKSLRPAGLMYYLWFIGVDPDSQNRGAGTKLLNEVIAEAKSRKRLVCLETSALKNLPWYRKFGFEIYGELDLGYKLFFLKNGSPDVK